MDDYRCQNELAFTRFFRKFIERTLCNLCMLQKMYLFQSGISHDVYMKP